MIKTCSYCKKEKHLSLFYKRIVKDGTNAGSSRCKECNKTYTINLMKKLPEKRSANQKRFYYKNKDKFNTYCKSYAQNKKDGMFYVYLLREEHYCGQTNSTYYRKSDHKAKGKYVEDMEIVMKFNTRREAKQLEKAFHKLGWYGENKLHSGNFKYL